MPTLVCCVLTIATNSALLKSFFLETNPGHTSCQQSYLLLWMCLPARRVTCHPSRFKRYSVQFPLALCYFRNKKTLISRTPHSLVFRRGRSDAPSRKRIKKEKKWRPGGWDKNQKRKEVKTGRLGWRRPGGWDEFGVGTLKEMPQAITRETIFESNLVYDTRPIE